MGLSFCQLTPSGKYNRAILTWGQGARRTGPYRPVFSRYCAKFFNLHFTADENSTTAQRGGKLSP
jgi:hypothetical protein